MQSDSASIELPAETASGRLARKFVREKVGDNTPDIEDIELMTGELVANVVEHVQSRVRLTIKPGPPMRFEVHNHEGATDAFRDLVHRPTMPAANSRSGRGLAMIRAMATRYGLDDDPGGGKVVWFEIDPPQSRPS